MIACPACGSGDIARCQRGEEVARPTPDDFRVTDARYGVTGPLYSCRECSFRFVVFEADPVAYYEEMTDEVYEEGRPYRQAQQRAILKRLLAAKPDARRLLDIGAGTGMLVQEAASLGLAAIGIEPSRWAVRVAERNGINVVEGTLPHPAFEEGSFDLAVLIDVIEHTPEPVELLRAARRYLSDDGLLAVITPDVRSLAARLLGRRWWHYRIAHVGYFTKATLGRTLGRAGFSVALVRRPGWVFDIRYLVTRLSSYLPFVAGIITERGPMGWLLRRTVALNLRDSLEVYACKR